MESKLYLAKAVGHEIELQPRCGHIYCMILCKLINNMETHFPHL